MKSEGRLATSQSEGHEAAVDQGGKKGIGVNEGEIKEINKQVITKVRK